MLFFLTLQSITMYCIGCLLWMLTIQPMPWPCWFECIVSVFPCDRAVTELTRYCPSLIIFVRGSACSDNVLVMSLFHFFCMFNRLCVAGALLQTLFSLIHSFIHWVIFLFKIFKILSIPSHKNWGVEILREYSPPTICHMSCSGVTCHVSHVGIYFCLCLCQKLPT